MPRRALVTTLAGLLLAVFPLLSQEKPAALPGDLLRLEKVWNEAHLNGDVKALEGLWADDISILVPRMPAMSKADVLGMWRNMAVRITRYESSDVAVRTYGDSAVVTGKILRVRDFGGRVAEERWLFTKVYVHVGAEWKVVAFQASEAPE